METGNLQFTLKHLAIPIDITTPMVIKILSV